MAKRSTRKPAKRATGRKPPQEAKGPRRQARTRPASPRSAVLPGMEQVRDRVLDNICEGIADERITKNAAEEQETSLKAAALKRMQTRNTTIYKHGGVELMRVPGSDKLRVKLTGDDESDTSVSGGDTHTGEGQDAGETLEALDSDNEASTH